MVRNRTFYMVLAEERRVWRTMFGEWQVATTDLCRDSGYCEAVEAMFAGSAVMLSSPGEVANQSHAAKCEEVTCEG